MISHLQFDGMEILKVLSLSIKEHFLFYSNGLAIWHGLPDIWYIKVNYG